MSEIKSPLKAIRAFCLECSGDSTAEVKSCPRSVCPLFSFRFGKNPYIKRGELTEEERQVLRERLGIARKSIGSSAVKMEECDA